MCICLLKHRRGHVDQNLPDSPAFHRKLRLSRVRKGETVQWEAGVGSDRQGARRESRVDAFAARRVFVVHTEDAVFVALERHRFAVGFQIGAGRMKIGERRLALHKP